MNKEQFEELCSAYVINALDDKESFEFSAYLKTASADEKQIYRQLLRCCLELPLAVESVEPNQSLKKSIIKAVSKQDTITNIFSIKTIIYTAAAIIISVLFIEFFISESTNNTNSNHLLSNGIMLISHESPLPKTFCHEAQNVNLVSKDGQSESAKLIWCRYHKISFLKINRMADLTEDKAYQLWMTNSEGESFSVGVLNAHNNIRNKVYDIHHFINLKPSQSNRFSITIEALNGVKKSIAKTHLISS